MRRWLVLVAVIATGCTAAGGGSRALPPADADGLVLASALQAFDSCDDLRDYYVEHALEQVGPYGLGGGVHAVAEDDVAAEPQAGAGDAAATAPVERVAGEDFSGTNVQEAGVDEPDIVKTDGRLLLAVARERLQVLDVSGSRPELVGSLALDVGWGHELLLDGDRLLILATADTFSTPLRSSDAVESTVVGGSEISTLTLVDLSDPSEPEVRARLTLDGAYVSARMVDGIARVVLRSPPTGLAFVAPEGGGLRAEREATERNRQIVRDSEIGNWLPYYVLGGGDGTVLGEGTVLDCGRVHRPPEFSGLDTLSVLTVDLAGDLVPDGGAGVVAQGETVYASTDNLYVATQRWSVRPLPEPAEDAVVAPDDEATTELHQFDISAPTGARYVASGSVTGFLLNQWALSEHDGFLRVATTDEPAWGGGEESHSTVRVLDERDGALRTVGTVDGLGKGERIYAVRYLGDLAYVVTFRETDPLYAIDLSDPRRPQALGELKILGYSAYLHPVGDGLLLGVGQDATARGRRLGTQLSLFDVADPREPVRLDQIRFRDGTSDVEYDHRAFLYWPETGLAMLPVQRWGFHEASGKEDFFAGALGITVGPDGRLQRLGRVTHDHGRADPWLGQIRRSVVVNDRLYTISEAGVQANALRSLEPTDWVSFSR